jgi:nicotinate dehydrogenase subunit A
VHLGNDAVRSCVTPVAGVTGKKITTLEGLGTPEKPHPLQTAFIDQQAAQCGYCTNAMIMGASAYMKQGLLKAATSEAQIKKLMTPYLCRCGTHYRILTAIQQAVKASA